METTYKVLKGYTFFLGEGRDAKIYKEGQTFQATEEQVKSQVWKVELISGKPAEQTQETHTDGDGGAETKEISKPPKNRMQRKAVTK